MTQLIITTNDFETIQLDTKQSIDLELKLNVTTKGHEWKHIGDVLFNFGSNKPEAVNTFTVTTEQFNFLKLLMTKSSWENCRGL